MSLPLLAVLVVAPVVNTGSGLDAKNVAGTYLTSGQPGAFSLSLAKDMSFNLKRTTDGNQERWPGRFRIEGKQLILDFEGPSPYETSSVSAEVNGQILTLHGSAYKRAPKVNLAGTWVVISNGKPDRSFKMVFDGKGQFRFVSSNAKSAGKYQLSDRELLLQWTEVDGEAVTLGTMKKKIQLSDDGAWFQLDRFRYERNPT